MEHPMKVHFSSADTTWETPQDFFDMLDLEFSFQLDVCASSENTKCERFYSENSLEKEWTGRCWMNPPYGREIGKWVEKAYMTALQGHLVVCLIPARTDTKWWHNYVFKGDVWFVPGRLKFGGSRHSAPFPSAVVVFRPSILTYNRLKA